MSAPTIDVYLESGILILKTTRRRLLDDQVLFHFSKETLEAVKNLGHAGVVLDLCTLDYLGGGLIAAIIALWKAVRGQGLPFAVGGVRSFVAEHFRSTHVQLIF